MNDFRSSKNRKIQARKVQQQQMDLSDFTQSLLNKLILGVYLIHCQFSSRSGQSHNLSMLSAFTPLPPTRIFKCLG